MDRSSKDCDTPLAGFVAPLSETPGDDAFGWVTVCDDQGHEVEAFADGWGRTSLGCQFVEKRPDRLGLFVPAGRYVIRHMRDDAETQWRITLSDAERAFDSLPHLLADPATDLLPGTTITTRREGYVYTVAASADHLTTRGGVHLHVEPVGGQRRLRAFGAGRGGDDTAAIGKWLSSGGALRAEAGHYNIAAAGPDQGGVIARVASDTQVTCSPDARFVADAHLDADIIRMIADPRRPTRPSVSWAGGFFDQRQQCNSTSIPFPRAFPAQKPGASATTSGLSIRGEIRKNGIPAAGFDQVAVRDITCLASDDAHWQTAGGDEGLFVGGAQRIHVSGVTAIGSRDLGVYASGLSSGEIEGVSCVITGCRFEGCMFGAATKRRLSNVEMTDNTGHNTAVLCHAATVTGAGRNIEIARNTGYQSWRTIRVTGGQDVSVKDNLSVGHGVQMRDGAPASGPFLRRNACVSLEGASGATVLRNHTEGKQLQAVVSTVQLLAHDRAICRDNHMCANSGEHIDYVIREIDGADNLASGTHGTDILRALVHLTGPGSIDAMLPVCGSVRESRSVIKTHSGTTGTQLLAALPVLLPHHGLNLRLHGQIMGRQGAKSFRLGLGRGPMLAFRQIPASAEGAWWLDVEIWARADQHARITGAIFIAGQTLSLRARPISLPYANSAPRLSVQLGDARDVVTLLGYEVRAGG